MSEHSQYRTNRELQAHRQLQAERAELDRAVKFEEARFAEHRAQIDNLLVNNRAILKSNELCLYAIKESVLEVLEHYRKVEKLLGKVAFSDFKFEEVIGQLAGVQDKTTKLERYFYDTFRMTPDQYKAQKMKNTKCSLN